jgi:hypothetical protein
MKAARIALCRKRSAKGKLYEETRAMNRTQENASSFEWRRPLVPDAPEWFNRARDVANRRPVFRSLPDPPPPPPRCRSRAESRIRFHGRPLVLVLSLVALPLVFGIGFWTHGSSGSGEAAVAHSEPGAAALYIPAQNPRTSRPREGP